MDPSSGLRIRNLTRPVRFGLWCSTRSSFPSCFSPPFHFNFSFKLISLRLRTRRRPYFYKLNTLLPLVSLSSPNDSTSYERGGFANSWSNDSLSPASHEKILQVVLYSPQIPGNTGCIARTCAASAVGLHLIEPLGFQIDDTKLKRAGLDYWPYVVVKVHGSWAEFKDHFRQQAGEKRLLAFTKRGMAIHSDFSYRRGDWLVFGSETCGLPPNVLLDCNSKGLGGGTIRIPMVETYVRCLNLSVSVGIALYEAARQLNYEQIQLQAEGSAANSEPIVSEDIFA